MSIQGKVDEINSIKKELKVIGQRGKLLRKRVKALEYEINEYLEMKDQPGMKYKGVAIIREEKTVRKPKKKNEQKMDAMYILENYGIENPEKVLEELLEARRGDPEETTKIQYKKEKKKGKEY